MANVFRQFLLDVEHGDFRSVERSITNGIDLETRDEDEQTALILAARCNHFDLVKLLVDAHADINAKDVDDWTALLNASQCGNLQIVQVLVENGAQIDYHDCGGFTPLMWASYHGHTDVVKYLLTKEVNVDALDEHGISSLAWASGRNHLGIVAVLLEHGASPNLCDQNNTSPLMWASRRGFTEVVTLLMRYNANVNATGMKNMNALLVATKGGHNETALRLLENRTIDIKIQDKDGQTSLSYACAQAMTETVAELLRRHAYVNTVDKAGDPVLFAAVKGGDEDCVALLLENHADINAIGAENKTAIWWAVEKGRLNIVKHLIQYVPDIEVPGGPDADTPLLLATKLRRVGIVYELIKYGAKLSSVDRFGDNSLHIAIRNRSRDIVDILLSNPRHAKYLYRPNKRGETPYKIDSNLQKSILTAIFGQRTLNLNDDSILGYDLYSSALAEILTEPSLQTPITVGLFAKWGSGKSALLTHLKNEMRSFAQLTDFPNLKVSPFLISVILIFCSFIGLLFGSFIHYIVGLGSAAGLILICFSVILFIRYLIRNKNYEWTAKVAHFIKNQLDFIRFLLQVSFMNPYGCSESKGGDYQMMKFIFTEYGKVSTTEGEKAVAGMIADLAQSIEENFGLVATRLCRALHSKNSTRYRFRYICCIPAFVFVLLQIILIISLLIMFRIYDAPAVKSSVNTIYLTLITLFGISVLLSSSIWIRLVLALIKSPKSKIMKFTDYALRHNESSIYQLKKEVSHISHIIKTVEVFLNINTRLVVLIDGLDVCEQQRIIQILDQVHVLLTKDDDPFITLIVCDPHKMMQDMNTAVTNHNNSTGQSSIFDTSVNGHDYLRSIIQLPVYLQLDLSKTKQIKVNNDGFRKRRNTATSTGASTLDVSVKPITTNQMSRKKRRRQRRDTLPNTKPVTTSELTHQLLQSDYFSDIDPRILQRLINVIGMTGRLLRAHQVLFSWKRLGCWSYLVERWPYRVSWIIVHYEDHEYDYPEETTLKDLYKKIRHVVPMCNDSLPKLDYSERKFESCMEHGEPALNLADLKLFLVCTCNLDPYLNKLIRESNGYFFMNQKNENELSENNFSKDFSRLDFDNSKRFGTNRPNRLLQKKDSSEYSMTPVENRYRNPFATLLKGNEDDESCHPNASSITSMIPNIGKNPGEEKFSTINNPTADFQLDLSTPLSQMSTDDVCEAFRSEIIGLKPSMIPSYINDVNENNISGTVLAVCELDELKKVLSMTFGDWVIFSNWIRSKRDTDCRSENISTNYNPSNDYRNSISFETNFFPSSLGEILSKNSQNNYLNPNEEVYAVSRNDLRILSAPKNVKFLIPLSRSGIASNESTIGINDLENRFIPDARDLFSTNSSSVVNSQNTVANNSSLTPILEQITSTSDLRIQADENRTDENDSENFPLLSRQT